MTIDEFVANNKTRRKTVEKWIKENLIPMADLDKDYIPDSARKPYTHARAKNAGAIYVSMVEASFKGMHILPVLYKITNDEFDGYVKRLIKAGLIEARISDGITYYDATIEACNVKRKYILDVIRSISQGVSEGVTTALMNNSHM